MPGGGCCSNLNGAGKASLGIVIVGTLAVMSGNAIRSADPPNGEWETYIECAAASTPTSLNY